MTIKQSGIKIFAPAVVSNLGPTAGIFCAAIQEIGLEVKITPRESGGIHRSMLEGAKGLDPDQAWKPVIAGVEALLRAADRSDESLGLHVHYRMPNQKGLHEEVSACVAGVMAANEILRRPLEKGDLFDVVCAALDALQLSDAYYLAKASLYGGIVLRDKVEPKEDYHRMPVPRGLQLLVLTPEHMPTQSPPTPIENSTQSHAGRCAAFVHALYLAHFELLRSTMDHSYFIGDECQDKLLSCMKGADALGAGISGNGPSLWGLYLNSLHANEAVSVLAEELAGLSFHYKFWIQEINQDGAIKC